MSLFKMLIAVVLWGLGDSLGDFFGDAEPPGGACIDPTGKPWCQP